MHSFFPSHLVPNSLERIPPTVLSFHLFSAFYYVRSSIILSCVSCPHRLLVAFPIPYLTDCTTDSVTPFSPFLRPTPFIPLAIFPFYLHRLSLDPSRHCSINFFTHAS